MAADGTRVIVTVLVVVVTLTHQAASTVKTKWTKEEYPNPIAEPAMCRRNGVAKPRVCDPNKLVEETVNLNRLDDKIKTIRSTTLCPCGPVMCNQKNEGYSVSIALVEEMKRPNNSPDTNTGKLIDARMFAEHLGRVSWNFSRCDNDVMIFYSKVNNVLYIATGKKTQMKLTDDVVHELILIHQNDFQDNVFSGLIGLLDKIEKNLKGQWPIKVAQKSLPDPPENDGSSASRVPSAILLISLILASIVILF